MVPTEFRTAVAHAQVRAYKLSEDGQRVMVIVSDGDAVKAKLMKVEDLDSIPPVRLAEDILPLRMALVVGSVPWKRQLEEFRRALRFDRVADLLDSNADPRFTGFDVERAEIRPDQPEPQWKPFDVQKTFAQVARLSGRRWEDEDRRLGPVIDLALVMKRPMQFRKSQYPPVEEKVRQIEDTLAELAKARGQTVGPNHRLKDPDGKDVIPGHVLLRFFDVTIRPGTSYKYRVRLRLLNPNYHRNDVAPASAAADKELKSDWAYVSDTVRVPPELYYYAVDLKTQGNREEKKQLWNAPWPGPNQVAAQIHEWLEAYVPPEHLDAKRHSYAAVGDWVIAPRALLTRGEYLGVTVRVAVPIWNIIGEHFDLAPSADSRTRMLPVFFGIGQQNGPREPLLVDFTGGPVRYDRSAGTDEERRQPKYTEVRDTLPVEMLILSADGKLSLRNSQLDLNDIDRANRYQAWKERLDEINAASRNPRGPWGNPFDRRGPSPADGRRGQGSRP
jgi:hypothetical protein